MNSPSASPVSNAAAAAIRRRTKHRDRWVSTGCTPRPTETALRISVLRGRTGRKQRVHSVSRKSSGEPFRREWSGSGPAVDALKWISQEGSTLSTAPERDIELLGRKILELVDETVG